MTAIKVAKTIVEYLFNLRISDLLLHIACAGISVVIGYCAANVLICLPVSIWEHFAKKKVQEGIVSKIVTVVTVCISATIFLRIIYEKAT